MPRPLRRAFKRVRKLGKRLAFWRKLRRSLTRSWRTRGLYRRARSLTTPGKYAHRRRLARSSRDSAAFEIDPDLGFKIIPPGELAGAEEVVAAAKAVVAARRDNGGLPWSEKKPFIAREFLGDDELTLDSPFLRFGMSEDLVGAISGYLGVFPVLTWVDIWCSRYHPGAVESSQLWHCDSAEVSQVKVWVHCGDVDENTGPLTIVDAKASREVIKKVNYSFGGPRNRVSDEVIESEVPKESLHPLVGPEGTVALVDTSRCFHFGSRVSPDSDIRFLTLFQYLTPWAFGLDEGDAQVKLFRKLSKQARAEREKLLLSA
jgi:hypothetical protein